MNGMAKKRTIQQPSLFDSETAVLEQATKETPKAKKVAEKTVNHVYGPTVAPVSPPNTGKSQESQALASSTQQPKPGDPEFFSLSGQAWPTTQAVGRAVGVRGATSTMAVAPANSAPAPVSVDASMKPGLVVPRLPEERGAWAGRPEPINGILDAARMTFLASISSDWVEMWEERSAILQHMAGETRLEAEKNAFAMMFENTSCVECSVDV